VNLYLRHLLPPSPDDVGAVGAEEWDDYVAALEELGAALPGLGDELTRRANAGRGRAAEARRRGETRAAMAAARLDAEPDPSQVVVADPIPAPPLAPDEPSLGMAERQLGQQPPRS
jgi:hypothetical protein